MGAVFSKILSMSLSASFVIGAVLVLRLLLWRAPKKYSYILWLLVFFRLLCPFTIESPLSLVPVKEDAIAYQGGGESMKIDTGIGVVDRLVVEGITKAGDKIFQLDGSVNDAVSGTGDQTAGTAAAEGEQRSLTGVFVTAAGWIWVFGMAALLAYGVAQVLRLRYRLRTAVRVSGAEVGPCPIPVYESDSLKTAFLLGLFRPRIYLPLGIEEERGYVIAHEWMHRKRLDHIVKPICYLAVVLHWFNPLVWLAFCFMTRDMEMACDEQVLGEAIRDIRSDYSKSLLKLSVKGSGLTVPLAFGETNTKERIKHALNYRRPSVWIGIGAILVIIIAAVTLLTAGRGGNRLFGGGDDGSGLSGIWQEPLSEEEFYRQLSENRNPYIGDASANGRIIGLLPGLAGYEYAGTELQTSTEPYELTIFYQQTEPISVEQELENADIMARNAMYLFAAIENMGRCQFELEPGAWADHTGSICGYGREEMEAIYGPLYEKSETPEGLRQLAEDYDAYQEEMRELLSSAPVEVREEYWSEEAGSAGSGEESENPGQDTSAEEQDLGNTEDVLEALFSEAILNATADTSLEGKHVEVHTILGGESAVFRELTRSDREMVFYLLVRELTYDDSPLTIEEANAASLEGAEGGQTGTAVLDSRVIANRVLAGSSFPARVTISRDESGAMSVSEFWVPGAGTWEEDIRAEFPEEYWNAAITMEGYQESLEEAMLQKISSYFAAEMGGL